MPRAKLKTIGLITLALSASLQAGEKRPKPLNISFPDLDIFMPPKERSRLRSYVDGVLKHSPCFEVKGYYWPAKSSQGYRIIGRTRAIEVFRQLLLLGVNPKSIHINSAGKINQKPGQPAKPPGALVTLVARPEAEAGCSKTLEQDLAHQNLKESQNDLSILNYALGDADPLQRDLLSFIHPGSSHLNR